MLKRLQIKQHFAPLSDSVSVDDPVWKAWRMMKNCSVKNLPVLKGQKIVGVVSDRDIVQISGFNGGQSMPVKDAMSMDPLVVCLEDSMQDVLQKMLKKDQQIAVVVDGNQTIVGLFLWSCAFQFILDLADVSNLNQLLTS